MLGIKSIFGSYPHRQKVLLFTEITRYFSSKGGSGKPKKVENEVHPISRITVYKCDLPLKEGSYRWSEGKSVSVFDSTVVRIDTATGITGWGEVTPLGPFYLPSYALGARSGLHELAPQLLGMNAINLSALNHFMDKALKGHNYVKSPIDMACWDILGKVCNLPLVSLLGGRHGEEVDLYRAISQLPPKEMAENVRKYKSEGYNKFQLKMGSTVPEDIARIQIVREKILTDANDVLVADANTGWLTHEALQIIHSCKHLPNVYIEEPCPSYAENQCIRRQSSYHPLILDECIDSVQQLVQCIHDRGADVINLKISKLGGLTKAKELRDLCIRFGLAMCIEDTWGGDITTAAIAHLAHSTPQKYRFSSTDFNSYNTVKTAHGSPIRDNGRMKASHEPGLGVEPILNILGDPVASFQ
ncbi:muconate lactonizing enzyme [Reticulomyxa filosa]|uniref:Muconate lactonizing enzyme n=1 Tax=Reticulomyxa filosa TaxID=46433 RepID=X6MB79_RETFI|nr:muconate lactonizing enzyme [Reticulomyxa filosa]|eukprot:ETO11119.1 muconate lactonizing enzyme [Reticulomyxa filosa]